MSQTDVTTVSVFEGLYKKNYSDELLKLIPLDCPLQNDAMFVKKLGADFNQPMLTGRGHGITFRGPACGKITLNEPVAPAVANANVTGYQAWYRTYVDYETLANAGDKDRAFIDGPGFVIKNELESFRHYLELSFWFGQSTDGLGVIATSGYHYLTLTEASFAAGAFFGMENGNFSVYDGNTLKGNLVCSGVDVDTRKIMFTDNPPVGGGAGKKIWAKAMRSGATHYCPPGLIKQLETTTGTVFSVNRAASSLTQPTQISVGGPLSFVGVASGVAKARAKGLDGDAILYTSLDVAQGLVNAEVSKQVYNDPTGSAKMTVGGDVIYQIAGIKVTLRPTSMCPNGKAALVKRKAMKRIGSWDIKEGDPAHTSLFQRVNTGNYFEACFYTNQTLFIDQPARTALFSGITIS